MNEPAIRTEEQIISLFPRQGNFNLLGMGAEKNGKAAFGLSAVLQVFGRGYPGEHAQV